jgi:hypothetical protein
MNDREKIELIAEAVRDVQRGILHDLSFFNVVAGIVLPAEPPTEEMLAWGKQVMEELKMCKKCGKYPATQPHPCPYNSDVNNDNETLCNCCYHCASICADDI